MRAKFNKETRLWEVWSPNGKIEKFYTRTEALRFIEMVSRL
jgi:hypothetical protein